MTPRDPTFTVQNEARRSRHSLSKRAVTQTITADHNFIGVGDVDEPGLQLLFTEGDVVPGVRRDGEDLSSQRPDFMTDSPEYPKLAYAERSPVPSVEDEQDGAADVVR